MIKPKATLEYTSVPKSSFVLVGLCLASPWLTLVGQHLLLYSSDSTAVSSVNENTEESQRACC
jgi:hypothetical protein